eukprot:1004925_1
MSGLLKNEFQSPARSNWVFPPRRRDNMNAKNYKLDSIYLDHLDTKNVLSCARSAPISICSERTTWFELHKQESNRSNDDLNLIHFQKEFTTAWVDVLEQYRLFWESINTINSESNKDLKSQSTLRTQKYAHPQYRKLLTQIQKTRMFSSFQCIRSLAKEKQLKSISIQNKTSNSWHFDSQL